VKRSQKMPKRPSSIPNTPEVIPIPVAAQAVPPLFPKQAPGFMFPESPNKMMAKTVQVMHIINLCMRE
jgi:hypothetical protein